MTELEFLKEKVKLLERIADLEREVARLKADAARRYDPFHIACEKFWKGDGWRGTTAIT